MTAAQVFLLLGMLPFQSQELNERLCSQCKTQSYNEKMHNVTDIWLKRRYIDKMPMYSRPEKIICILEESSVQSMSMVSRGVIPPHKFWSPPPLRLVPSPPTSPPLCSSKSPKQKNYGKAPCIASSDPQPCQAKHFARLFNCSRAKLTFHVSNDTPTNLLRGSQ